MFKPREPERARTRRHTLKVARRRRHLHLLETHPEYLINPSPENVDCVCETSRFYFAKKFRRHRCSKRRHGNPKFGQGVCHLCRRAAVDARIRSRRLARDLASGRVGYDDVEPARTFYGMVERRRPRPASAS